MNFPALYECSVCNKAVKVTPREGQEPLIERACEHHGATIWANRKVTVVHGARTADGLAYQELLREDPAVHYLATVTRDPAWTGRTTRVQQVLEEIAPTPDGTHAMLCGNPEMIAGVRALLEARGFKKHRKRDPGNLHFEAYW